jgi:hypothetical protein
VSDRSDSVVALLQSLITEAELEIEVRVAGEPSYVVEFAHGAASIGPGHDPESRVILSLSAPGADRVRSGKANAQQLLAAGDLRIGGRIDVLQAEASALSATRLG